jgi:hypothetical protein
LIVSQAVIDQIRGRMRRRVLELPVKRGSKGELKVPVRAGGVYTLKPPIPADRYKIEAEQQPTRARAILHMIDLCETPVRTVTVTVTHPPERQKDKWLVRFEKGDWRAQSDRPIFLAKYGDYTMTASKQAIPGDPELMSPFAKDLAKARARALECRVSPQREAVQRAWSNMEILQESMTSMKIRVLLKRAQRNLEAADRLLSTESVHCDSSTAADGSQGEEGRPPNAGAAVASLNSEAA